MTRIIAGRAGGRRIDSPKGDRTRPTTDRTKEALFSSIVSWFNAADRDPSVQLERIAVLDLYSGSGSIALEAASRGAAPVVAVEADRGTATVIRRNATQTELDLAVQVAAVNTYLSGVSRTFDLVFADPPYSLENADLEANLAALSQRWLAPDALVVVERSRRSRPFKWPTQFVDTWSRGYGETTLYFGTPQSTEG